MARRSEAEREKHLQEEVSRLRSKVRSLERKLRRELTERFMERLEEEMKRSERYEHLFGLLVLTSRRTDPQDVHRRAGPRLRRTDFGEVIQLGAAPQSARGAEAGIGAGAEHVAAVLPETNRAGAQAAVDRLKRYMPNMGDVKLGFAVYPDDSTDAQELLRLAAGAAV